MLLKHLKQLILILFFILITDNVYAVKLKIATLSPEGSMWMEKMREGANQKLIIVSYSNSIPAVSWAMIKQC